MRNKKDKLEMSMDEVDKHQKSRFNFFKFISFKLFEVK